jgi:hypothetical protein
MDEPSSDPGDTPPWSSLEDVVGLCFGPVDSSSSLSWLGEGEPGGAVNIGTPAGCEMSWPAIANAPTVRTSATTRPPIPSAIVRTRRLLMYAIYGPL